MENKSLKQLKNPLSIIIFAILIGPLSFVLIMVPTSNITGPNAYAYDYDVRVIGDKQNFLKFVSAAETNGDMNNASNAAQTQIPESAKGPTIPGKGYLVKEIRDNLYWLTDGSYNTMFLVTDKGVVAIDAPPSIGQNYLRAIAEVTDKPVTYVIYSHAHIDHIGAAGMFPRNATYIAQEATSSELRRAMDLARNTSAIPPVPTVTFANNYTLQIGNQTLDLDYYGDNHMPGNLFIYAPNQKTLMLVDVVFPGWVPFVYLALSTDVAGFVKSIDMALNNYDFDTFVGGHLTRLGTPDDVKTQKEFVNDLEKAAVKANSEVQFADVAAQVGKTSDTWLLYSKYIDAVDQNCVQTMLTKWEDRLGGAAAFMPTHCFTMTEAGRVEPSLSAMLQNVTMPEFANATEN
jgi:glyoxylase-like metal-dependent hydrolase (beta-lactamase superfamily II)